MQHKISKPIQSLDRGLQIIEFLARAKHPVTLNEMTAELKVNKSTAFRLANTLHSKGFIEHSEGSKAFILGPTIWSILKQYNWNEILANAAHSIIEKLAHTTQETTHLAIRHGQNAHFINHQTTNQALVVSGRTGESVPLYCTAHGKALLADYDLNQLKDLYFDYKLEKFTKNTITDINRLAAECKTIKSKGYALDDSEFNEDITCIAAPIRDIKGNVIASVGISAPSVRLSSKGKFKKCLQEVIKSAKTIEDNSISKYD